MKDARSVLIIDMGSGYLKCGPRQLRKPAILPACFETEEAHSGNPVLLALDPGRTQWHFPLEDGTVPVDADALGALCNLVFRRFPPESANRKALGLMLLLFPCGDSERITDLCGELREMTGCLCVETSVQQILTWGTATSSRRNPR